MRRRLWPLLLIAWTPALAANQVNLGGSSELFSLSQQPAGARALALGGAFEAVADDSSAAQWNPAAPAMNQALGLGLHHETWLDQTDREVVSAQLPLSPSLGLGAYGSWINYGSTQLRDSSGAYLGQFSTQEQGLGLAVSGCWGGLALGLAGRYLRLGLPGVDVQSAAGDLGLLWQTTPNLRLASVLKLLPQDGGTWAVSGNAGLALQSLPGAWRWCISSTVRLDPATAAELDAGLELGAGRSLPLLMRLGYSQAMPDQVQDLGSRFSGGLGINLGRYQLDYAYLPWGSFGATHRISLSLAEPWNRPSTRPIVTPEPTPAPRPIPTPHPQPSPVVTPTRLLGPAPSLPQAHFRVLSDAVVQARALEAAGRYPSALMLYHQAATAHADDLAAWKGLASLYARLGQVAYAQQCWRQVLRIDSSDPDALQALATP